MTETIIIFEITLSSIFGHTDIITSWLKEELAKVQNLVPHSVLVEKLTGDNTMGRKRKGYEAIQGGTLSSIGLLG